MQLDPIGPNQNQPDPTGTNWTQPHSTAFKKTQLDITRPHKSQPDSTIAYITIPNYGPTRQKEPWKHSQFPSVKNNGHYLPGSAMLGPIISVPVSNHDSHVEYRRTVLGREASSRLDKICNIRNSHLRNLNRYSHQDHSQYPPSFSPQAKCLFSPSDFLEFLNTLGGKQISFLVQKISHFK